MAGTTSAQWATKVGKRSFVTPGKKRVEWLDDISISYIAGESLRECISATAA